MSEPWVNIVTVLLVTLGIAAEVNLMRVFLQDWREGGREERRRFRANARTRDKGSAGRHAGVKRPALAACLTLGVLPTAVHAQNPAAPLANAPIFNPQTAPDHAGAQPAMSPFSLQLNLDYTTAYFYHGIIQEDSGLILQPAAKLTVNLYEQHDFKVDAYFAKWNSFHGHKTAAQTHGDFTEFWYESDLIAGFTLTKGKFSLSTQYVFLTSPSDAYETVQELDFTLAFDDSDVLGKFALHPYALLAIETGADASDGANSNTGTYLELGIAPGFSFDVGKTPVSITFPASIGLSLHDYYQNAVGNDNAFGFAQVAVKASVPLPFGDRYGTWTLNAGVSAMFLGDHTAQFNGGQREQVIGTIGLQLNF